MKKKVIHSSKSFLNKNGFNSVAAICVTIHPEYMKITISDCNRAIDLTDDLYSTASRSNAVFKMQQMIKELEKGIKFLQE